MTPEEEAPMPQMTRPDVAEALHAVHSALHSGEPCGDYLHEMVRLASETPVADREHRRRLLGLAATPASPESYSGTARPNPEGSASPAAEPRTVKACTCDSDPAYCWAHMVAAEPQEGEPSMEALFTDAVVELDPIYWQGFRDGKARASAPAAEHKHQWARLSNGLDQPEPFLRCLECEATAAPAAEPTVTEALCDRIVNNGFGEPTECGRTLPCEYHDAPAAEPTVTEALRLADEHRLCGTPHGYDGCYSHPIGLDHCRADGMGWPCDVERIRAALAASPQSPEPTASPLDVER